MKSKTIPADIRKKSLKEAQNEIKEIMGELEKPGINLESSIEKFDRMLHLNNYIQENFKKMGKEILKKKLEKKEKKK
tara:strand:+ start:661 stop:891 length:231 start_codon:yes stop_codon:yes gene_type:complete